MANLFHEVKHHLKRTVEPTAWPVNLQEVKDFLDFGTTTADDNRRLMELIPQAVDMVENDCQRGLCNQTWQLKLDSFPEEIELRVPPVTAVSSVTYIDADGDSQTFSSASYDTDLTGEPGRIKPKSNGSGWPTTKTIPNAVTVTFTAGYENDMPAVAKNAVLLAVKSLYHTCDPGDAYWSQINRLRWEAGL